VGKRLEYLNITVNIHTEVGKTKLYEVVVVDSKSRVMIPSKIRDILGLSSGSILILIADTETREIRMLPLADAESRVYQLRVVMSDKPGALAKVAQVLANHGVDLLFTVSKTIRREEVAEWSIVADFSKSKVSEGEVVDALKKLDIVREVKIVSIKRK